MLRGWKNDPDRLIEIILGRGGPTTAAATGRHTIKLTLEKAARQVGRSLRRLVTRQGRESGSHVLKRLNGLLKPFDHFFVQTIADIESLNLTHNQTRLLQALQMLADGRLS